MLRLHFGSSDLVLGAEEEAFAAGWEGLLIPDLQTESTRKEEDCGARLSGRGSELPWAGTSPSESHCQRFGVMEKQVLHGIEAMT